METIATIPFDWPDRDGPWKVQLEWSVINGRAECSGVRIANRDDVGAGPGWVSEIEPKPITASVLRQIPLGALIARGRIHLADVADSYVDNPELDETTKRRAGEVAELFNRKSPRGGRPRQYGAEHYAEVADVYRRAWNAGEAPTKAVAEHFGPVSRDTAAKWVKKARDLGLLGKTAPRKAGGVVPDAPKRVTKTRGKKS